MDHQKNILSILNFTADTGPPQVLQKYSNILYGYMVSFSNKLTYIYTYLYIYMYIKYISYTKQFHKYHIIFTMLTPFL